MRRIVTHPSSLFSNGTVVADVAPEYLAIQQRTQWNWLRDELEQLWHMYREYADSHFCDQIQRRGHFHSRIWEMRVACAFLASGHHLSSSDEGPDFTCSDGSASTIHVEAIAPEPCETIRSLAVKLRKSDEFVEIPDHEIVLRLTSAISEKRRKYIEWSSRGLVSHDDAYIIAVSSSKFGPAIVDPEHPVVLYPLFGIAAQSVTFPADYSDPVAVECRPSLVRTKPESGALIDNFLFRQFEHGAVDTVAANEVSAVVFSDSNFRFGASKFDDFIFIHNPATRNPVPEGVLPYGREYALRGDHISLVRDYRA